MGPDREWSVRALREMARPCVYAWRRRGGTWLYVGRTVQGLARVLHGHHVISMERLQPRRDYVSVWYTRNDLEANRLESELIRRHRPQYNEVGKPRGSPESMDARVRAGKVDQCARPGCGRPFARDRAPGKRFCSDRCRNLDWIRRHRQAAVA